MEHRAHFLILYYPLLGTGGGKISPAYSEGMLKFKREVLTGLLKCLHAGVSWEERIAIPLVLYITLRGYAMLLLK